MVSMGIDGMVSGLDTTSLINQLMQAEAMPQTLLKTKQTSTTSFVTALQSLNTKVASLAEAATTATKPVSWQAYKATASATSVTATTTATALPSELSFKVTSLASNQVSILDFPGASGAFTGTPPTFTIRTDADSTTGTAKDVTVTAASDSVEDVVKAINSTTAAGVKAVAVKVDGTYRIQLTGSETGATKDFEVFAGAAGTLTGASVPVAKNDLRTARDAEVLLWAGSGAEKAVKSTTNTFANVLDGVSFTVSALTKADEQPVTLTVARDDAAVKKLASGLVGALGVVLSDVTSRTSTTTKTGEDGRSVVTGGLFSGDSAVRGLAQQLQTAASYPVDGVSPTTVGIVVGRDGTFTFDEAKFSAALAADPAKVEKVISGLAQRVADVATKASDKVDGSLTAKITSQQGVVKDLGNQIANWDLRLATRRAGLQKTYASLEVSLSGLRSQSSWLAGQLSSLSGSR
ncbi:flagellar filament capping protein FliD [Cellulomonas cellasea]|uniref:Flagellar hook-associated protein 2 n=2 Tax=Cellulomonas cellasea TaxID=43670 RepID=A0A0A0B4N1_9CELL|nr:flagellar filament capping protein FliD [Cellulomonas cellasea]KGM01138.1 flagellar cap protein [Cellulomonas cellasea DSM 20118]GEA90137.1 B-type flagellar hook-associated protein 2 [Cellulomonas cellasea]